MLTPDQLYLEIPEIKLPDHFYDATEPFLSDQQKKAMDFMSGINFDTGSNTNFITTTHKSPWETATTRPEVSKELLAWCRDTFNLKFFAVYFVRTKPGGVGPWHCEGPILKGRRCALNFLITGELGKTHAQWGTHKTLDVHPEEIEKHFTGAVPTQDVGMIAEYTSKKFVPFFYNTACLHRSYNSSINTYRTLLSVSLSDNIGIDHVKRKYDNGTLFKT